MTETNKISLYNKEGGASKQYTLWLESKDGGWLVNFQFGPIGGWVKDGTKTKEPVSREKAEKVYSQLLKSKKIKGYHEGADAPAFSQTDGAVDSGLRLMLLTPAKEEIIEYYLLRNEWAAQEKMNGKRIAIKVVDGDITGVNKSGLVCPIPEQFKIVFSGATVTVDGELIGSTYHLFDLMESIQGDNRGDNLDWRDSLACRLVESLDSGHVKKVPLVMGEKAKRALVEGLKEGKKEGVVFKLLTAPYEPGKRSNLKEALAVKIKFFAEGAYTVLRWNTVKQSIQIGARDGVKLVNVGNVTVADKWVDQIVVGEPVRVRYLYATTAKRLYQPNLDPTDDGDVMADQVGPDSIEDLKFEGKEED